VPNTVVLPDRLGRGGAARPPQPSSQGPAGAGDPGPRSTTPSPTRGRRHRPAQVMVGLMPPTLPLTACAPPCHSLGCTARIPAPRPTGDPAQPAVPGRPCDRTRSAARAPPRRRPGPARRRRWPSTACAGSAMWLPDAPTRSTKAPVRTQRTRTGTRNARTPTLDTPDNGHPDTRTPGHPDTRAPGHPDTRTRGHRTRGHWTPDTGRVDADRGCGQGDQATAGIRTSGPPRRADDLLDAEPCSCGGAAHEALGNHDGSAVRPPPARETATPPAGNCSVAPPAVSGASAHCSRVLDLDGTRGGQWDNGKVSGCGVRLASSANGMLSSFGWNAYAQVKGGVDAEGGKESARGSGCQDGIRERMAVSR
jgi:hypothetical protein